MKSITFCFVVFSFLFAMITNASAASGRVTFNGVILPSEGQNRTIDFPRELVSFSSQIAIPVHLLSNTDTVRILEAKTRSPVASQVIQVSVGSGARAFALVDLGQTKRQTFLACIGSSARCVRFGVTRY